MRARGLRAYLVLHLIAETALAVLCIQPRTPGRRHPLPLWLQSTVVLAPPTLSRLPVLPPPPRPFSSSPLAACQPSHPHPAQPPGTRPTPLPSTPLPARPFPSPPLLEMAAQSSPTTTTTAAADSPTLLVCAS